MKYIELRGNFENSSDNDSTGTRNREFHAGTPIEEITPYANEDFTLKFTVDPTAEKEAIDSFR